MEKQDCDQLKLIPEGCLTCGDKAIKYCASEASVVFEYCKKCVSDFTEAGGCDCMKNEGCDQFKLIPEGCSKCGDQAMKYCSSKEGNNATLLLI